MSIFTCFLSTNVILLTILFAIVDAKAFDFQKIQFQCQESLQPNPPPADGYRFLHVDELNNTIKEKPSCTVWLRTDFELTENDHQILQLLYPTLDWAQPWVDGIPYPPQGGSLDFSSRKIPLHLPTWNFLLYPGKHRIELSIKDTTGKRRIPYTIQSMETFLPHLEKRSFEDGILLGLLIFHFVTAVVLAFVLGSEFGGRLYAIFVMSTVFYLVIASGHAFPILWPSTPALNSFILMQCALLSVATLAIWSMRFQKADKYCPLMNQVGNIFALILLIAAALMPISLFPGHAFIQSVRRSGILDGFAAASMLWLLAITAVVAIKARTKESYIMLIGFSIPLVIIVLAFVHDLGFIHITQQERLYMLQFAAVIMFGLLSGYLAARLQNRLKNSAILELRYSTSVVQAGDRVRERIARELHDNIAQRLVALQFGLYNSGQTEPSAEVRSILKDLRAVAHSLHPTHLLNGNLGDALHTYARQLESKGICHIDMELDPHMEALEGEPAVHMLRIVQELTNNALQHGHASLIHFHSSVENKTHILCVKNDGLPMPVGMVEGFGLTSIRARIRLLEGFLEIKSKASSLGGPEQVLSFPT